MANLHCLNCSNKTDMQECLQCDDTWNKFNALNPKGAKPNTTKKKSYKKVSRR